MQQALKTVDTSWHKEFLETLKSFQYGESFSHMFSKFERTLEPFSSYWEMFLCEIRRTPIVLCGGRNGTPLVGRALYKQGYTDFSVLASTSKTLLQEGKPIGSGIIKQNGSLDFTDCGKQLIHSTPIDNYGVFHPILDAAPYTHLRVIYLLLQVIKRKHGPQNALNIVNGILHNPYQVVFTTQSRNDVFFVLDKEVLGLYEYAFRKYKTAVAQDLILQPTVFLSHDVTQLFEQARYIIFGPGDPHFSVLIHFPVLGFRESLARSQAEIILILNLTARPYDTPNNFTLRGILDLYRRYLPVQKVTVLLPCEPVLGGIPDDMDGILEYENFILVREDIGSNQHVGDDPACKVHHEEKLGLVLSQIVRPS